MNGDKPKATKLEKFLVFFIAAAFLFFGYRFLKEEIGRRERAKAITLERTRGEIVIGETNTVVPKAIEGKTNDVSMSMVVAQVDLNAIRASVKRKRVEADKRAAAGVEENFSPEFDGVINPVE